MSRSPIAYLGWHARDAVGRALVPYALFLMLAGIPMGIMVGTAGLEAARTDPDFQGNLLGIYLQTLQLAMTLGALLIASGFVAQDRERGHVRLLFAAPVVPWRHYLLRYLVGALLFVAACALPPLTFSVLLFEVPVAPVLLSAALYALLVGALGLLAGAITRHDGAVVIGVALLASILQAIRRQDELPGWLDPVAVLLPPLDAADQLRGAWLLGRATEPGDLLLVLGYAVGMLLAALFVIRRAPLVR